ncbi:MAG: hypothetical protein JST26_12380 [Bacteroidetes bacterium]|nr:hypothetical protein [Bacteroidota bacterium]
MKKTTLMALVAGMAVCMATQAQTPAQKGTPAQKEITFTSAAEKQQKIHELEQRIKINTIDQTYPAADLQAEKKELELVKKAKIKSSTH